MIVMLTNHTGIRTGYLMGQFPGLVGHLFSPGGERGPYEFAPYALDNGAYGHDDDWEEARWLKLLNWARLSGIAPMWALVPDRVADKKTTLERWNRYAPMVKAQYGWPLAFAVQDGMTLSDVPREADVVFVGGTFDWKWKTVRYWCESFENVHVGRVNTYKNLMRCHDAGAKSTDGTGFMRGCQRQYRDLLAYLRQASGIATRHIQLPLCEARGLLDDEQPLYWRYALSLINALRAERARTIQLLRTVDELRGVPASEDPVISEQAVS